MKTLEAPVFESYEEEAKFWDELDTSDFMPDDGEWFCFDAPHKRALRVAILPQIAEELIHTAQEQGVSIETLVNVLLLEHLREPAITN